jgi:hypothetical protein
LRSSMKAANGPYPLAMIHRDCPLGFNSRLAVLRAKNRGMTKYD